MFVWIACLFWEWMPILAYLSETVQEGCEPTTAGLAISGFTVSRQSSNHLVWCVANETTASPAQTAVKFPLSRMRLNKMVKWISATYYFWKKHCGQWLILYREGKLL